MMCNKRGLTPLDVCQPQVRQIIEGESLFVLNCAIKIHICRNCRRKWSEYQAKDSVQR